MNHEQLLLVSISLAMNYLSYLKLLIKYLRYFQPKGVLALLLYYFIR